MVKRMEGVLGWRIGKGWYLVGYGSMLLWWIVREEWNGLRLKVMMY